MDDFGRAGHVSGYAGAPPEGHFGGGAPASAWPRRSMPRTWVAGVDGHRREAPLGAPPENPICGAAALHHSHPTPGFPDRLSVPSGGLAPLGDDITGVFVGFLGE